MKVNFLSARIPESSRNRGGLLSTKAMKMTAEGALKAHNIEPKTRRWTCRTECLLLILQVTGLRMGSAAPLLVPLACFFLSSILLHPIGHPFVNKLLIALSWWLSTLPPNFCPPPREIKPLHQHKQISTSFSRWFRKGSTRTPVRECETAQSGHNIVLYTITTIQISKYKHF